MKKKILIPTDFSSNAWQALVYAIELFKDKSCDFYILNTFQPASYHLDSLMIPEPGEKYYEACQTISNEGLEYVYKKVKELDDNPRHSFKTASRIGFLVDCIHEMINKHDIELIVMGTKGASASHSSFFGTNAVYIMEKVRNCPVLTIPQGYTFKTFKEIVFPTNYRIPVKSRELKYLIDIAQATHSSIKIVYIAIELMLTEGQRENQELLSEYLEETEHSFGTIQSNKTIKALANFVENRNSDMIAFVNRKHSFFDNLFSKPLVKELGYYSKIPILVLHDLGN